MRWLSGLFLSVFLSLGSKSHACDLALVLAVDVSGSVDSREFNVQMQGLAAAMRDPTISEALVVANASVSVIQWTGTGRQRVSVPWTSIDSFEDTDRFADEVETTQRVWRNFSTAIGEALVFAQSSFDDVPHCDRKIIDVSGDGQSNEGIAPSHVHPQLRASGIIVNGLAIEQSDQTLTRYYEAELITGPGAFAVKAATFDDYPNRIKRKLLREITKQLSNLPDHGQYGRL